MEKISSNKTEKISKGYRLKPATHELINLLQKLLLADRDIIIEKACKKLYKKIIRKQQNNNIKEENSK